MADRIEKRIELKAAQSRVWQALTDHREFGEWFGVKIDGPFEPGQVSRGHITIPGFEHIEWEALVQDVEPEHLFSYLWHPYAIDPEVDYSDEPRTLVEFRLQETAGGTELVVTESGFDALPYARRDIAFRSNDGGWASQMKNIESYLTRRPESARS